MRVSLNELVSVLASRVGQAWNTDLQDEMKIVLSYKRADFFKKSMVQNPAQRKFFLKDFSVELQEVDKTECPVDVECQVLRSVNKIPAPTRSDYTLFDFVGSADKLTPYSYATPEQYTLMAQYNKYTGANPKYFYVNGYLYIYGDLSEEWANVRGLYIDPRDLINFKCEGEPCYTDDDQYEIPDDLINAIIADTLRVELRSQAPREGEVQTDKNDKKVEQGGKTEQN